MGPKVCSGPKNSFCQLAIIIIFCNSTWSAKTKTNSMCHIRFQTMHICAKWPWLVRSHGVLTYNRYSVLHCICIICIKTDIEQTTLWSPTLCQHYVWRCLLYTDKEPLSTAPPIIQSQIISMPAPAQYLYSNVIKYVMTTNEIKIMEREHKAAITDLSHME